MIKEIKYDTVIGNAVITLDKDRLTKEDYICYLKIVDRLLPQGWYTCGDKYSFEVFCDRYPSIVKTHSGEIITNTLIVTADKNTLNTYFRIAASEEEIKIFEKAALIFKELQNERLNDNWNENNLEYVKNTLKDNSMITEEGMVYRIGQSTSPVKVKINKKSRKNCAKSLLK